MALKATLEPARNGESHSIDSRRGPRRTLKLHTHGVSQRGIASNVTIHNLSAAGLLIETDLELVPGDRLAIGLPDVGPVGAEIVWMSERLYGCAFEQALGEAALAASELRSEPGEPQLTGGETSKFAASHVPPIAPPIKAPVAGPGPVDGLGPQLNRLRRERSLTLDQVARALGVSKPTVWAWEKGKARPRPERIAKIAEVLEVPEAELTGAFEKRASASLIEGYRLGIASELRTIPERVRIMIEV